MICIDFGFFGAPGPQDSEEVCDTEMLVLVVCDRRELDTLGRFRGAERVGTPWKSDQEKSLKEAFEIATGVTVDTRSPSLA